MGRVRGGPPAGLPSAPEVPRSVGRSRWLGCREVPRSLPRAVQTRRRLTQREATLGNFTVRFRRGLGRSMPSPNCLAMPSRPTVGPKEPGARRASLSRASPRCSSVRHRRSSTSSTASASRSEPCCWRRRSCRKHQPPTPPQGLAAPGGTSSVREAGKLRTPVWRPSPPAW